MIKRFYIIILTLLIATACSKEEQRVAVNTLPEQEMLFTTDRDIPTRATLKSEWELGDEIGITMTGNNESFVNYKYTVASIDGTTQLSYYGNGTPLLYPTHEQDITLYAYSPYDSSAVDRDGLFTVSNEADFMVSDMTTYSYEKYSLEDPIGFTFRHLFSYVEIKMSPSDEFTLEDLGAISVYLDNHYTTMQYNINNDSMSADTSGIVEFSSQPNDIGGYSATSFVIPIYIDGVKIHFDNGSDYHTSISFDTSSYVSGKCYSYAVTIGRTIEEFYLEDIEQWGDTVEGAIDSKESPDGSEASPWLIYDQDDLASIATGEMGADDYYYIMNDITVSNNWTTLSPSSHFTGSISGNGYTIYGLTSSNSSCALLNYISSAGRVQDLNIANCSFTGSSKIAGIAITNYGSIQNCIVSGTMGSTNCTDVGAIVVTNYGSIINCGSDVDITADSCVGGVATYNYYDIGNCYSWGDITTSASDAISGGIVGYNKSGSSSSQRGYVGVCYYTGCIKGAEGASDIACITGKYDSETITERSYYANDTDGITTSKDAHGKSTAYMTSDAFLSTLNSEYFDGYGSYDIESWVNNNIGDGFPTFDK